MKCITLLLAGMLALSSCLATEGPALEHRAVVPRLVANAVRVSLTDARSVVDTEGVEVSAFTMPSQGQELSLSLDPALAGVIQETLTQRLSAATRTLLIEITVHEARAGWDANFMSEEEQAFARVEVSVRDEAGQELASGPSESWARRRSLDTSEGAVRRIFNGVLTDAVYRFLSGAECSALHAPPWHSSAQP